MANISSEVELPSGSSTNSISQPSTALSLNYDVLLGVFGALKHDAKSLLSIALVCTAFRDPAIAMLWESMDSIIPLLRLLPPVQVVDGVYMICEDLCDEDMLRFKFYAKKIRRFTRSSVDHTGSRYPPIAPPVLALLQQDVKVRDLIFLSFEALSAPETPCLIPYCSTLYTSPDTSPDTSCVFAVSPLQWANPPDSSLFIKSSSSLERVEIRDASNTLRDLDSDFSRIRPFMHALKSRAPDLQHLIIGIQISPRICRLIASFKNLRSLEISVVLDVRYFRHLAMSLPELQRLSVNILNPTDVGFNFDVTFPFDKLRVLKMGGTGLAVASYLRSMRGESVEVLSIIDDSNALSFNSGEQWTSSMWFMKNQWASSLQSLYLKTARIPMTAMFLGDLAAIALKSLVIEAKISGLDCKMLSRSLIAIHNLYIYRVCSDQSAPRLEGEGFHILVGFATHCRSLVSMEIGFEERIADSFSYLPYMRPMGGHILKTLVITSDSDCEVGINNFQHLIDAARLLYRLFPVLDTLRTSDNHASAVFWEHVYKLYKEFRAFANLQEDDFPWMDGSNPTSFMWHELPSYPPPAAPIGGKKKGKKRMI
ncbi:hypothetical protein H0H92_000583 [Tricholoma furcatifolium]|nr:hypothetical protein H0H92_000583 [Tricholoma furcatifolium]